MRFQVPQFIGVEDKVFGPLTVKQFIYLAGGAGMSFIAIRLLPIFIGIIVALPIAALSLALAFYQINNKPFIFTFQSAVYYLFHNRLYIWRKTDKPVIHDPALDAAANDPMLYVPKLADSKLKDMTWSLDISKKEALNPVTREVESRR